MLPHQPTTLDLAKDTRLNLFRLEVQGSAIFIIIKNPHWKKKKIVGVCRVWSAVYSHAGLAKAIVC